MRCLLRQWASRPECLPANNTRPRNLSKRRFSFPAAGILGPTTIRVPSTHRTRRVRPHRPPPVDATFTRGSCVSMRYQGKECSHRHMHQNQDKSLRYSTIQQIAQVCSSLCVRSPHHAIGPSTVAGRQFKLYTVQYSNIVNKLKIMPCIGEQHIELFTSPDPDGCQNSCSFTRPVYPSTFVHRGTGGHKLLRPTNDALNREHRPTPARKADKKRAPGNTAEVVDAVAGRMQQVNTHAS